MVGGKTTATHREENAVADIAIIQWNAFLFWSMNGSYDCNLKSAKWLQNTTARTVKFAEIRLDNLLDIFAMYS